MTKSESDDRLAKRASEFDEKRLENPPPSPPPPSSVIVLLVKSKKLGP